MASSTTDIPEMEEVPDEPKASEAPETEVPKSTNEQDDAQPVSPDSNTSKDQNPEEPPKVDTTEIPVHQSNRRAPVRFLQVEGFEGRTNDLVYCAPLQTEIIEENGVESTSGHRKEQDAERRRKRESKSNDNKVVIYFGGDIQDFPEVMELHADHRQLSNWNLEMTAVILQNQFPEHHIVVIRPSRMQMLTYSCYDNFVPSNNIGVPDHTPNHGALQHLEALLSRLSSLIQMAGQNREEEKDPLAPDTEVVQEADSSDCSPTSTSKLSQPKIELNGTAVPVVNPHLDQAQLSFIGFSKGCVVLNQFIYEFHYLKTLTPDDESLKTFLSCIEDMYWLDGGHNGGKNTWLTSRSLLETLTRLEIRIHVHMTPYQLCDERRSWIHKEEQIFSNSLTRFGASIRRYVHFGDQPPSLALHLQLVAQFMSPSSPSTIPNEEDEEDFEQGQSSLSMMATFLQDDDPDDDDEEIMYT